MIVVSLHSEISQKEFERFLKMRSRDPYVFQDMLAAGISNASPEIQSLVSKSSNTLLTNDEIMSIINSKMWNYAYSYTRDVVTNPANNIYPGLERVTCKICHKQQAGVIYNRNTSVGSYAQQVLNYMCDSCRALQNNLVSQISK